MGRWVGGGWVDANFLLPLTPLPSPTPSCPHHPQVFDTYMLSCFFLFSGISLEALVWHDGIIPLRLQSCVMRILTMPQVGSWARLGSWEELGSRERNSVAELMCAFPLTFPLSPSLLSFPHTLTHTHTEQVPGGSGGAHPPQALPGRPREPDGLHPHWHLPA